MNLPHKSELEMLRIRDRAWQIVPFRLNPVQQHLLSHLTGHDIVIKARQNGVSTLAQAIIYQQVVTQPEYVALTRPQNPRASDVFRRRFETFHNHAPSGASNIYSWDKYAYRFPQLNSTYHIRMKPPFGPVRFAHVSELAYWDSQDWDFALRHIEEGSERVLIESTSNPYNPRWFWLCVNTLLGKTDYTIHFYEWWWNSEYELPLLATDHFVFDADEKELLNDKGLTVSQIKWRRRKIAEMGHERFQYEYPERLDTALGLGD